MDKFTGRIIMKVILFNTLKDIPGHQERATQM